MPFELSALRFIPDDNRELESLTRYLADPIDQLLQLPITNGRLLQDIALVPAVPVRVEHKLEREYLGWIVVRRDASATVFESTAAAVTPALPDQFINLDTSTNVTISLWVF